MPISRKVSCLVTLMLATLIKRQLISIMFVGQLADISERFQLTLAHRGLPSTGGCNEHLAERRVEERGPQ